MKAPFGSGALKGGLAATGLVAAIAAGAGLGTPPGLLVGAGVVLVGVTFLLWESVQSLAGNTPLTLDEAMGLGAPSTEEERKQAVLRALKDLEYERSVGKISEEDFRQLGARYRAEGKALLQALDRDLAPHRERVLKRLNAELGEAAPAAAPAGEAPPAQRRACGSCGADNEGDARFCKSCAAPLGITGEAP